MFENILTFAGNKDYQHIIPELITALTYKKGKWYHGSIWHFLILSGYLSYERKPETIEAYAFIPNEKIRSHWLSEMKVFMIDLFDSLHLNSLREVSIEMNPHSLQKVMKEMISNPSYLDLCLENSYHSFFWGFFHHSS